MLDSPFHYDEWLTPEELQKLGQLSLRWSHIDHILGNCLKAMLRLSDEEAVVVIFPLRFGDRLKRIKDLSKVSPFNDDAKAALTALNCVATHLQEVRNVVAHAIMIDDAELGKLLHLRSKQKSVTIGQMLSTEELTNYAAHVVMALRYAIGGVKNAEPGARHPLPEKPELPKFLSHPIPTGIRLGRPLRPRLPPSRG